MIKISADHREVPGGVPGILEELGAEVEVKMLAIGDYHVSNDVIIERKTTSDFLHSIIDDKGHLYEQLADMMREYKRSLLMIEGAPMELYTDRAVHPNAIDGMILAAARFSASMIWTMSVDHTARMIYREAEHEQVQMAKKKGSPHGKRSHLSMPEQQTYFISAIQNLGPETAIRLLKHFGTPEAVVSATVDELTEVPKIGEKTAQTIREVVSTEYKA